VVVVIIVEGLSKKYGSKLAVNNVSFTVPDGQVTGFLGPNGSGKSTTMRCMLGLDAPTQGRVLFRGECGGKAYDDEFAKLRNKPAVAGAILDAGWFHPNRSGRNHLRVIARGAGISDDRVEQCLAVVGMVSGGAEIIADGNIHVYAPMRGRALAGESGDKSARIFLQSMQAELVSIAGIYRVFEQNLPPSLHKKAVQIELQDDERLAIFAINAN